MRSPHGNRSTCPGTCRSRGFWGSLWRCGIGAKGGQSN